MKKDNYEKKNYYLKVIATIISLLALLFGSGLIWKITEKKQTEKEQIESTYISEKTTVNNYETNTMVNSDLSSSSIKKVIVHNLIGKEQDEAVQMLKEVGLEFQVWWTEEDNGKFDDVVYIAEQSIPADSLVPVGTIVKLRLTPFS